MVALAAPSLSLFSTKAFMIDVLLPAALTALTPLLYVAIQQLSPILCLHKFQQRFVYRFAERTFLL